MFTLFSVTCSLKLNAINQFDATPPSIAVIVEGLASGALRMLRRW